MDICGAFEIMALKKTQTLAPDVFGTMIFLAWVEGLPFFT